MEPIPFFKPSVSEINTEYLQQVYARQSASLVTSLEETFSEFVGTEFALGVTNAANALHLSLCAVDVKRGDKIICSVNAHPAVPAMIRHFDAEPVFIDIDEKGLNMDLEQLEQVLKANKNKKLVGVIVSFIAGEPVDMKRFYEIVNRHNIFVIEDATDAMGASEEGRKVGNFDSDITVFSFLPFGDKASTTGAMLTTNDKELYERAVLMQNNAMQYRSSGEINYIYDVIDIGCDYNISGLEAAYCKTLFDNLEPEIERRKAIAARYFEGLKETPHVTLPNEGDEGHVFSSFVIQIDKNRDQFAKELAARGIETDLHYIPLHMMTYYRQKYEIKITTFPNALRTFQHILSLPIYAAMSDAEVDYVIRSVREIAIERKW